MPSQQIQWFPGHMAKTRRLISENLKNVDIVIELLDARIPRSSKNPEIAALIQNKPILTLLNKSSLADEATTREWIDWYKNNGGYAIKIDCITGEGISGIGPAVRNILKDKLKRLEEKGLTGRKIKAMIVGIPNVGKSSLVNKLSGQKKAKVEDRPGVTLNKQWVATSQGFELLDMPGVLWPKFDDRITGENLASTGAIKDAILDTEELGMILAKRLLDIAPALLCSRYKLTYEEVCELDSWDLLCTIGKKRGFLISGGEINTERTALMLLDEFRAAKIGNISLEKPE
ncbi:MAG: ribosome biogenesis GTPase YlqF [Clostridia bacterium]|nr:ribosome biogenesis GTPase YlqF [Clostridia bacterium]MBR6650773.1 ribosome biogenesis GTPase YlqF [Clostridia bacterium]